MAESRIQQVIDALVAQSPTAPGMPAGVHVSDGYPVVKILDSTDLLAVGVDDPADPGRADSGDSTQTFPHAAGRARDEAASVRCAVNVIDPDAVAKTARDRAFVILAAVAALVRAGGAPFDLASGIRGAGVTEIRLYQNQTDAGAECLLVFSVVFTARI
ncbi:MAG TPA: hypothetical protein VGF17_01455 [Phytomonospora sp.]